MNIFKFHDNYKDLKEKWNISCVEDLWKMAEEGKDVPTGGNVSIKRLSIGNIAVFIKKYDLKKKGFRYLGRKSPAHKEYNSYTCFSQMGLLHPEAISWGDLRKNGRLHWTILVLKEIPNAANLTHLFLEEKENKQRVPMLEHLAKIVAKMHRSKFYHGSCRLRNFLYQPQSEEIQLYCIDCPSGHYKRLPIGRALSYDLTSLYKDISRCCSQEEWNKFIEKYSELTNTDCGKWKKILPGLCEKKFGKKIKKLYIQGVNTQSDNKP